MGLFRFIFSKTFLIQIILAVILIVVLTYLAMQWLGYSTNQGERLEVPNLAELSLTEVETLLEEKNMRYEILDSANFNPDYPRFSVIEQVPKPGKFVKENRKIYLTLNPSGYRKVMIPDLIRRTRRQAEPTLKSLGFEIGEISFKPDIAEDAVLELRYKGKTLKPGDEVMKTAKIDLVLGDGSGSYSRYKRDSIETEEATEEQFDF